MLKTTQIGAGSGVSGACEAGWSNGRTNEGKNKENRKRHMLSLPLDSTVAKEPKTALHKELRVVRETALQKI